jgi:hypothetical protein
MFISAKINVYAAERVALVAAFGVKINSAEQS